MKALTIILAAVILLGGILTLNACQSLNSPLEDYNWILTSWTEKGDMKALVPDTQLTACFNGKDKTMSGSGGCNQYSGSYKVDGLNLTITELVTTLMSCGEQKDEQERQYLNALKHAANFKLDHGNLIIYCGMDTLQFKREDASTKTISQWGE
jgi:heat shock protein HslJ